MMGFSPDALRFIVRVRPRRLVTGHIGKFMEGLPEKLGTGQAPMDPGMLSTALGDRGNPGKSGDLIRRVKARPIGAHGHQQPGC